MQEPTYLLQAAQILIRGHGDYVGKLESTNSLSVRISFLVKLMVSRVEDFGDRTPMVLTNVKLRA